MYIGNVKYIQLISWVWWDIDWLTNKFQVSCMDNSFKWWAIFTLCFPQNEWKEGFKPIKLKWLFKHFLFRFKWWRKYGLFIYMTNNYHCSFSYRPLLLKESTIMFHIIQEFKWSKRCAKYTSYWIVESVLIGYSSK